MGDTTWPEFHVNNGEVLLLHYGIPIELRSPLVLLNILCILLGVRLLEV